MKLVAFDFPTDDIHTVTRAINESNVQHLLVGIDRHPSGTYITGLFRGSRDGDSQLVRDALGEWSFRFREAQRRAEQHKLRESTTNLKDRP